MRCFYMYKVRVWDLIDCTYKEERGFINAVSYADATAQLTDWYGEDEMVAVSISILDEGDAPLTLDKIKELTAE